MKNILTKENITKFTHMKNHLEITNLEETRGVQETEIPIENNSDLQNIYGKIIRIITNTGILTMTNPQVVLCMTRFFITDSL